MRWEGSETQEERIRWKIVRHVDAERLDKEKKQEEKEIKEEERWWGEAGEVARGINHDVVD